MAPSPLLFSQRRGRTAAPSWHQVLLAKQVRRAPRLAFHASFPAQHASQTWLNLLLSHLAQVPHCRQDQGRCEEGHREDTRLDVHSHQGALQVGGALGSGRFVSFLTPDCGGWPFVSLLQRAPTPYPYPLSGVKVGHMGMTWKQIAENILAVMPAICEVVPQKVSRWSLYRLGSALPRRHRLRAALLRRLWPRPQTLPCSSPLTPTLGQEHSRGAPAL